MLPMTVYENSWKIVTGVDISALARTLTDIEHFILKTEDTCHVNCKNSEVCFNCNISLSIVKQLLNPLMEKNKVLHQLIDTLHVRQKRDIFGSGEAVFKLMIDTQTLLKTAIMF